MSTLQYGVASPRALVTYVLYAPCGVLLAPCLARISAFLVRLDEV